MKFLCVTLFFFNFIPSSYAGILLEPYLGYDFVVNSDNDNNESPMPLSWSAPEIGLRAGYMFNRYFTGLDIDYKIANVKMHAETNDYDGSIKIKTNIFNAGLAFGVLLDSELFFRAKYYFSSTIVASEINASVKGSGFGVDIGAIFIKHMAINLEFAWLNYDELVGVPGFALRSDISVTEILLSLSFPFHFGKDSNQKI